MQQIDVDGARVPSLGFGTWQLSGSAGRRAVADALEVGYRHLDTAQMYRNERQVGQALVDSGVPRDEVWITTKIDNGNHAADRVRSSTTASLRALGTDYVDLLLIHWPVQFDRVEETLAAMAQLQQEQKVRHLGVSNFSAGQWQRARSLAPVVCNQVEYHPFLEQEAVLQAVRSDGGFMTAYSPLARGRVVREPTLRRIAEQHGRTPAQVTLRWLLDQDGVAPIPKAAGRQHIEQNFAVFDFTLSDDERRMIDRLGGRERSVDPPAGGQRLD